jgi:hypothetical protein
MLVYQRKRETSIPNCPIGRAPTVPAMVSSRGAIASSARPPTAGTLVPLGKSIPDVEGLTGLQRVTIPGAGARPGGGTAGARPRW